MKKKVMKEEGCSFKPRTNKKVNSMIVHDDMYSRTTNFMNKKQEKIKEIAMEKENEFQYRPQLVSKPYKDKSSERVQDRLYNRATEYEMRKEELRRNQVDAD